MKNQFTGEMINQEKTAENFEELMEIAKKNGIEMTTGDAKAYYEKLNKVGELSDDELDNVSGGGCNDNYVSDENSAAFRAAGDNCGICPVCGKGIVTKIEITGHYCQYECKACGTSSF